MTAATSTTSRRERLPVVPSLLAIGAGLVWSVGSIMKRLAEGSDAFQYLI
jgi:hypothetical protein